MCTENTFADFFCVQTLKRYLFSEFSVYIRKDAKFGVLSIENVDFIRIFLLYTQKRNDRQNLVPKMGIYLLLIIFNLPILEFLRKYAEKLREPKRYLRIYTQEQFKSFRGHTQNSYYLNLLLLCCCFTSTVKSKVMSGRSDNLTTLSWTGLDLLSG